MEHSSKTSQINQGIDETLKDFDFKQIGKIYFVVPNNTSYAGLFSKFSQTKSARKSNQFLKRLERNIEEKTHEKGEITPTFMTKGLLFLGHITYNNIKIQLVPDLDTLTKINDPQYLNVYQFSAQTGMTSNKYLSSIVSKN